MENAIQEHIQAKTRDGQLFKIFDNHFEFSSKTAEAVILTVAEKEICKLHCLANSILQDEDVFCCFSAKLN